MGAFSRPALAGADGGGVDVLLIPRQPTVAFGVSIPAQADDDRCASSAADNDNAATPANSIVAAALAAH